MRDKFIFSDNQTCTNLDSTGEISTNIWDLEEDVAVDQMIEGFLNITIISATLTSGLTEGLVVGLRTDDAVGLATAQNGTNAGYVDVGTKHLLKEEIVAGRSFSMPFRQDVCKKYLGGWAKAKNTALVGNIHLEMWFENNPVSQLRIQKKPQ